MNKENITYLMKAGFSLDEIIAMDNPSKDPPEDLPADPAPKPAEQTVGKHEKPADDAPAQPVQVPDQSEQIAKLTQAVADLTALVQKNNITGMQFGAPQPDRSVDDILAEIINPPMKKS